MNLLPKPKQQELTYERLFNSIVIAVVIAVILMLLGVVLQVGIYFYLNRESSSIASNIETMKRTANKTENTAVKQEIRKANAQIQDFSHLADTIPLWSNVMTAFIQNVPQGVNITQFSADAKLKQITITGYAPTRDLVIDLYNNINADKDHFKDINYPLENVSQPANVTFNFTFTVVDSVVSNAK